MLLEMIHTMSLAVGFVVLSVVFFLVLGFAWMAISFWYNCNHRAKQEEAKFYEDLQRVYGASGQELFDRVYHKFWEDVAREKSVDDPHRN